MKTINNRNTEYPVDDLFLKRYSPRAMSGETLTDEELMTLFEAARWAPSSMNAQPWRFIYAKTGTAEFDEYITFLDNHNRDWCIRASVLVVLVSKDTFENGTFSPSHSFDAGSASENLALEATNMGLVSHSIGGFDKNLAKEKLNIPDGYTLEIMIAIGKHGKIEDLPEPLQAREKPSDRKPLGEIAFEGKFRN